MKRTKLVAGNWKMNLTVKEAVALVQSCVKMVDAKSNVDVIVCPPSLAVPAVVEILHNTHIKVGAQDVFWMPAGAFTGKISPLMLADAGVTFCIVGHSESRGRFGSSEIDPGDLAFFSETDHTINLKIKGLLYHAINPILCVGETRAERDAGQTDKVIRSQIDAALDGIDGAELFFSVIAYEPVWAIGTGQTCETSEASRVCSMIRQVIHEKYGEDLADEMRILYGGSVKASNAGELFAAESIDGGLVGGASLDPSEFSRIVMSA